MNTSYSPYRSSGENFYDERSPRTSMALTGGPANLTSFKIPTTPSDSVLAAAALADEHAHRFPSFCTDDAVTLGLSLRKRFRASRRARTLSLVLSVSAATGAPLFQCAVGEGVGSEEWGVLSGMLEVVRRTGHSSWYVEKGLMAAGEGARGERNPVRGGAFPIYLENAPAAPIAIVAAYSGSSEDDHRLVVNGVRDYIKKLHEDADAAQTLPPASATAPSVPATSTHATSMRASSRAESRTASSATASRPASVASASAIDEDAGPRLSSADWLAMHAAGEIQPDVYEGEGGVSYTDGRTASGSVLSARSDGSSTADAAPLMLAGSALTAHGYGQSFVSSAHGRGGQSAVSAHGLGASVVSGQGGARSGAGRSSVSSRSRAG